MPFQSTNAKPLSTLNARNILAKENVPKTFSTSHMAAKKPGTASNITKKPLLTGLSEKQPSSARHSNLPKLNSTKSSEKENALVVERPNNLQGNNPSSRLPLKSIKNPNSTTTSTTRPATVTRGFSQAVNTLKHTSFTSTSTRKPSKPALDSHSLSSVSENVLTKDSLSTSSLSTVPSVSTSISSTASSSIPTTTSSSSSTTLTSLPISTSKVPKSIPKKRVINEENIAAAESLPTISSSPLDDDKENRIFASSISSTTSASSTLSSTSSLSSKYSSSKYSSESLGEELDEFSVELDSATSTARSKKLKITDSDASSKSRSGTLPKFNYKSIHLHEEVIEEQDEQEWTDKENRENESQQHRQSAVRAVSQPARPLAPSHAFPTTSSLAGVASKQKKEPAPDPKSKPEWMIPPPSLTLSEKMNKFGIPEIDVEDVEDVTLCAEYVQEILEYLMRREKMFMPMTNYIELHPELQWHMRVILVDWLMEVSQKFKFLPETIFLGVNIMDRFLSKRTVSLNKFQLVGLASLFIAAKIEEIYCPPVSNFTFMTDSAFNDDEMLRAEQYILKTLAFEIWAPGPFSFIRRISKVDDYNADHRAAAKFLAESSLLTHHALCFPPSLLAASTMYLARWVYKAPGPRWSPAFQAISGYLESDLLDCVRALLQFILSPCDPESFFFKKKYIGKKFVYILYELRRLADEIQSVVSPFSANTSNTATTTTTTTSTASSSFSS